MIITKAALRETVRRQRVDLRLMRMANEVLVVDLFESQQLAEGWGISLGYLASLVTAKRSEIDLLRAEVEQLRAGRE